MKNSLKLSMLMLFLSSCELEPISGQLDVGPVNNTFERAYEKGRQCPGAFEDKDGNFIVYGSNASTQFYLFKISPEGVLLDQKTWGGADASSFILDITTTSDDFYLVTGHTADNADKNRNYYIGKLDQTTFRETGVQRGGMGFDAASSSIELPNGSYLTLGHSNSFSSEMQPQYDFYFLESFPSLDLSSRKELPMVSNDEFYDNLISTSNGDYILIGHQRISPESADGKPYITRIDSDMNFIPNWRHEVNLSSKKDRLVSGIELQDSNGFLMVGLKEGDEPNISSIGAKAIAVQLDNNANAEVFNLSSDRSAITDVLEVDDGIVFLGHKENGGDQDYWLFKTSKTDYKSIIWERFFDAGLGQDELPEKKSLVACSDGGFLIAGMSFCFDEPDCERRFYVVKTDFEGKIK